MRSIIIVVEMTIETDKAPRLVNQVSHHATLAIIRFARNEHTMTVAADSAP